MSIQKHNTIALALREARRARDKELLRVLHDPEDAEAFARLVDHPYLLSLAELVTNQCTGLVGARLLIENLLAVPVERRLLQPVVFGMRVETLEKTDIAQPELTSLLEELCSETQARAFLEAVGRYRCIDNGYGVVPDRSLLEIELERRNSRFLRRVVLISSGKPRFSTSVLSAIEQPNTRLQGYGLVGDGPDDEIIDLTMM